MKKEMLINVLQPEESRIAIIEDGVLEELYVERISQGNLVGNIYKGRVVNIEPSIQAVFVDFGVGRNGFLHVSDVEYQYYKHLVGPEHAQNGGRDLGDDEDEDEPDDDRESDRGRGNGGRGGFRGRNGGREGRGPRFNERSARNKPPIQEIFQRGSEVLVQVIKEGIGTKGPTLSTYVSIPGRYLVLMPGLQRVGVSRKIADEGARRQLRQMLRDIQPPEGLGFIVRTAGVDRTKQELERDMQYLLRLWRTIVRRIKNQPSPVDIYEESDMITRTIRDIYTSDIEAVWIDEPKACEKAREFMDVVMPKHAHCVKQYEGKEPIFHTYRVEQEIDRIQSRHVPMDGGGSLVIDQTEALVAIDVNSGSFRVDDNAEETAFQVNMKAAEEIARQIRLRDLGGVIVNDFIDMREERHRRHVERKLRDCVRRDRARTKVLRISPFGIIEMTRQRIRPSLRRSVYEDCPCCRGVGQVKTAESVAIEVMRTLMKTAAHPEVRRIDLEVHQRVADYLVNKKRREMTHFEEGYNVTVNIQTGLNVLPEHLRIRCLNDIGAEIPLPISTSDSNSRR